MAKKEPRSKKVQDDIITGEAPLGTIEMMADDAIDPQPDETSAKRSGWSPKGNELKVWTQFKNRKAALLNSRANVYGLNIDAEMRRWDKQYFRRQADIPASELDANQRPLAINNAYGKIQTALGILIDADPSYILEEDNPKYSKNREFLRLLAEKSFRNTNSLGQFKLSVFNAAKRGWFVGRTFNRRLYHDARFLKSISPEGKRKYETKTVQKIDDIAYMNLNNYNVWIDEQTKPEDFLSTRDWMWREVQYIDDIRRLFPEDEFPNMKYVRAGGNTQESLQGVFTRNAVSNKTGLSPQATKKGMTEMFFYENQYSDQFIVEVNNVMIVAEPLPQNNKRLSCIYGSWHLRGDDTIYGLGVIEEMETSEELIDRVNNMDMRQLLLTISPSGFFSGSEDMEEENVRSAPGIFRRTLDPDKVKWLQIPQGNSTGLERVSWLEKKQDEKTGITPTIEGMDQPGDQTAFEIGVQREAGLKRLRLPLKSLQYALSQEFQNRIALIQQTYSTFEVEHLQSAEDITAYLDDVKADRDFFFIENEGQAGKEKFYALKYRMVNLNIDKTEDGKFIESESSNFFQIKPEYLQFSGFITIKSNSLLATSEALEQANTLRMTNLLIPLLSGNMQTNAKIAKQLLIAFNKDQRDWLPQDWIDFLSGKKPASPPPPQSASELTASGAPPAPPQTSAPTAVPPAQVSSQPSESALNGRAFTA